MLVFFRFVSELVSWLEEERQLVVSISKSGVILSSAALRSRCAQVVRRMGLKVVRWLKDLGHDAPVSSRRRLVTKSRLNVIDERMPRVRVLQKTTPAKVFTLFTAGFRPAVMHSTLV